MTKVTVTASSDLLVIQIFGSYILHTLLADPIVKLFISLFGLDGRVLCSDSDTTMTADITWLPKDVLKMIIDCVEISWAGATVKKLLLCHTCIRVCTECVHLSQGEAQDIMRLQLVCKTWNAVIRDKKYKR